VKGFGPLPPPRAIDLLRQACLSLAEAHETGLIHRDIKPANIFVCKYALEYDFVKVLDFGLVKSNKSEQSVELTQPGALLGTPAYMAPEMMTGDKVDARADLYSLGCVAFWLLTGKPPFEADTATAVMLRHLTKDPPSPRSIVGPQVSEQLDAIVLRCLAKKPEGRPQNASELQRELGSCATHTPWSQVEAKECWGKQMQDPDEPSEDQPADLAGKIDMRAEHSTQ
jgi:serine/threonine-protein kinase